MRQKRWFAPAALAIGLFAINIVARLVIRFFFHDNDSAQSAASVIMFALIGLTLAVWTFLACQRKRPSGIGAASAAVPDAAVLNAGARRSSS